jgi:cell division protein FtsZ
LSSYNLTEVLSEEPNGAKIKVIGVGGGGGNMIDHMIRNGINNIELIVANTDAQVLERSLCENRIQLGEKITRGLGAGMQPEVGSQSAEESKDEIREHLDGADIVFIAAGLGGGTGTGASPVIAQVAREIGALTISVITKPFTFEGGKRKKVAEAGLEELKKESDSIVVIPNDKLLQTVDRNVGVKDAFKIVDDVLSSAVVGATGIILKSGENDINIDFADLRTVMSYRGLALMGMGEAEGEKSAFEAIKSAIESPLLDDISINGAMGVLVHFSIHRDYSLIEIYDAMELIRESADPDASIIMGTTTDTDLPTDYVKITLIATGFEKSFNEEPAPATITKKEGSKKDPFISRTGGRTPKKIEALPTKTAIPQPMEAEVAHNPEKVEPVEQKTAPTRSPHNFGGGNSGFPTSGNGFPPPNTGVGRRNPVANAPSGLGSGFPGRSNNNSPFPTKSSGGGFGGSKRPKPIDDDYLDTPTWIRNQGNR